LSLDLIGLPPQPEDVNALEEAYASDPDGAYEAMVDGLLASPRFGERWTRT